MRPQTLPNPVKWRKVESITLAITMFKVIKVTGFGTNRKLICDFRLVINNNLHHILHRSRYIAFNIIRKMLIAIAERPRCRVRYSFRQK